MTSASADTRLPAPAAVKAGKSPATTETSIPIGRVVSGIPNAHPAMYIWDRVLSMTSTSILRFTNVGADIVTTNTSSIMIQTATVSAICADSQTNASRLPFPHFLPSPYPRTVRFMPQYRL